MRCGHCGHGATLRSRSPAEVVPSRSMPAVAGHGPAAVAGQAVPAVPVVMVNPALPGSQASLSGSLGLAMSISAAALAFFGMVFWLTKPIVSFVPIGIALGGVGLGAMALGQEKGRGQGVTGVIMGAVTVLFVGGVLAMRFLW